MLRLNAEQLIALGAPPDASIQQIEDWLRALLGGGTLSIGGQRIELRGGERVVTTLGDLKKACGVASETVKQGLRSLQLEHWIVPVEGEHTCLVGPPRFQVAMTKRNFAGSSAQAVELSVTPGVNPLTGLDYERLAEPEAVAIRKRTSLLEPVTLTWSTEIRLPDDTCLPPQPHDDFTLAAGSSVRLDNGHSAILSADARMKFGVARAAVLDAKAEFISGKVKTTLDRGAELLLKGNSVVRLPRGATGILSITPRSVTASGEQIDWGGENSWLARFDDRTPRVLLRRVIYASLRDVVGEPDTEWKVAIGVHDAMLDASVPFQAKRCSAAKSSGHLMRFLQTLGETDSLRAAMADEYGWTADNADVRVSPVRQAGNYDRRLLRTTGENKDLNSELLCLGGRMHCWVQVGAYFRRRAALPWEITREVYFPYVDLHIVQGTPAR